MFNCLRKFPLFSPSKDMLLNIKYTPKIHFIYLNTVEIYYNFSTCCIISVLFFKKCHLFHSCIFLCSNNTHVFHKLWATIWIPTRSDKAFMNLAVRCHHKSAKLNQNSQSFLSHSNSFYTYVFVMIHAHKVTQWEPFLPHIPHGLAKQTFLI